MLKMLNIKKILTKILQWIISPITTDHAYRYKNTSIDRDASTASSDVYPKALSIYDKNGKYIGYVEAQKLTNGTSGVGFAAVRTVNDTDYYNSISLGVANDGSYKVSVASPSAWRSALGAQEALSVTTPTITFTNIASGSSVVDKAVKKYGRVVMLHLRVKKNAAVAAGADFFSGTISQTALRPINSVYGVGYTSLAHIFVGADGSIQVRNGSSGSASANTEVSVSVTYISAS